VAQKKSAPLSEVLRPPLLYRTLLGISLGAIPVVGTAANANWVVPWTDQVNSRIQQEQPPAADGKAAVTKVAKKPDPRQKAKTQIQIQTAAQIIREPRALPFRAAL
jgi:hypothetical protein